MTPDKVQAAYMGNVCSAGLGQAPARQAALQAGLPMECVCTTVNKVCASGLKSVTLAAQEVALGVSEVVVAGGMEVMSNVPYYLLKARFGYRMGDGGVVDGLVGDGLRDAGKGLHMGVFAERCAKKYEISREAQDEYARESYRRSEVAWREGRFKGEIAEVRGVVGREEVVVREDEEFRRTDVGRLVGMRAAFVKDGSGTVTSGNASGLNDGAAAVVLMKRELAVREGREILGVVRAYADAETNPEDFSTAPALAIPIALKRAGVAIEEVDWFEVNEAFSVVAVANARLLGLDMNKTNVWGGAVSLGHPLGSSGARILVTLLSVLKDRGGTWGVAGICNGGGGATAIVVSRDDKGKHSKI